MNGYSQFWSTLVLLVLFSFDVVAANRRCDKLISGELGISSEMAGRNFATNLATLMRALNVTKQGDLVEILGSPKTTINKWMIEEISPKDTTLAELVDNLKRYSTETKSVGSAVRSAIASLEPGKLLNHPFNFSRDLRVPGYAFLAGPKVVGEARDANDKDLMPLIGVFHAFRRISPTKLFHFVIQFHLDELTGLVFIESMDRFSQNDRTTVGVVSKVGGKPPAVAHVRGNRISGDGSLDESDFLLLSVALPNVLRPSSFRGVQTLRDGSGGVVSSKVLLIPVTDGQPGSDLRQFLGPSSETSMGDILKRLPQWENELVLYVDWH